MMPSQSKETIRVQSDIVRKFAKAVMILAPLCSFAPLINLSYPHHDYECVATLLGSFLAVSLFIVFFLVRYLSMIGKELDKHLEQRGDDKPNMNVAENDPLVEFRTKIKKTRILIAVLGVQTMILYGIIIFWEFIAFNSSYFWPILMLTVNVVFSYLLKSMINDSSNQSSSDTKSTKSFKKVNEVVPKDQPTLDTPSNSKQLSLINEDQIIVPQIVTNHQNNIQL